MMRVSLLVYIASLGCQTSELSDTLAKFVARRRVKQTRVWSVREAKENLSIVLNEARAGRMQIVQDARGRAEPVVVISVGDLQELVRIARRPRTLADMFRFGRPPIEGPLVIREGASASERFEL